MPAVLIVITALFLVGLVVPSKTNHVWMSDICDGTQGAENNIGADCKYMLVSIPQEVKNILNDTNHPRVQISSTELDIVIKKETIARIQQLDALAQSPTLKTRGE